MSRVSVLEQMYLRQRPVIVKQHDRKKDKYWQEKCRFYLICMLIGILVGGIPLAVIVTMYARPQHYTTAATPSTSPLCWNPIGITIAGISGVPNGTSDTLDVPYHVTLDYSNTLYIADWRNNRVQKFLRDASSGTTVAGQATGVSGTSSNQLYGPARVLLVPNGDIFVVDQNNNRVQFLANGASTGTTVAGNAAGIGGSLNNMLSAPFSVERDPSTGTLYIADYGNQRVISYISGASTGTVVAGGNGQGLTNNNTQLNGPVSAYFDSLTNSLVIVDLDSNNIVRWVLGDISWTLIAGDSNGLAGNTSTLFNAPRDVTFDRMGNMFVADKLNHRIQFFMVGQTNGITIGGITGISGVNSTLLNSPHSIELDNQLNLYVADSLNHRIQKFVRC